MPRPSRGSPLFEILKAPRLALVPKDLTALLSAVDRSRIEALAASLAEYIRVNLPATFEKRTGLADYRSNPYVLMASASAMSLLEAAHFADFLFNTKLYMALETSFGKSVESAFLGPYPVGAPFKWADATEKITEFAALTGLPRQERARRRTSSAWREIDKSVYLGQRRFLLSIKSGPNTINDTQVQGMTQAIIDHHAIWLSDTLRSHHDANGIDVVIGLTYGTPRTTNNKENQILAKLLDHGFVELDRAASPGVLVNSTGQVRVYRVVGRDFWSFVGNPLDPPSRPFIFLEALLALAKALTLALKHADLETRINNRIQELALALSRLRFPAKALPSWIRDSYTEDELFWFAAALTAFYDEGI